MEGFNVSRVEKIEDCAVFSLSGVTNAPGTAHRIFSGLSKKNVNLIFILQSTNASSGSANVGFTIHKDDVKTTKDFLETLDIGGVMNIKDDVAILSVAGVGLYQNPGVAARIFELLYDRGIDIHLISTSEIKILAAVDSDRIDEAYKAVSKGFSDM